MINRWMVFVAAGVPLMLPIAAEAALVSYFLNQSGNATAGVLSPDGVSYARVDISDDLANQEIDFVVTLLPNVIAQFNPSANNRGIKSFAFNVDAAFPALSGTSAATNNFTNLVTGGGFNWTVPSSRSMDGFGTFEVKLDNTGSARLSTLTFSLSTASGSRWAGLSATNLFDLSSGNAPQGTVAFAIDVDGISTAGAQGGNPFFGGSVPVAPVPLPASLGLMLAGLGAAALRLRPASRRLPAASYVGATQRALVG
jgi:hypothetical protein